MINQSQIDEILEISKKIEIKVKSAKAENEKLEKELLVANTKKEEIIKKMNELGVTEDNILDKIKEKYEKIKDAITKFEELNK